MNFTFVFKAAMVLAVVAVVFVGGVVVGGGLATGTLQDGVVQQVEACMPAQTAEELRPCLETEETP